MVSSKQIPVTGMDGLRGFVDPTTLAPEDPNVLIHLEGGRSVLVPAEVLVEQPDGGYYVPLSREQLEGHLAARPDEAELVVPVVAEQVRVTRREVPLGRVRITKHVHEREEEIDQPHFRENVQVERIPVNRVIAEPAQTRLEGDTMIIPVMEEVLVIEKRILLKEEVRVTKRLEEVHEPKQVTLREEEVRVERTEPSESKKK